jgi:hypothetical protein
VTGQEGLRRTLTAMESQESLFSPLGDVDFFRHLIADLHDDLAGKVARFRQLADLSLELGAAGTMIPGGHTSMSAWLEARSSFVHGNYVATVMLCQGLAEHVLASHVSMGLDAKPLPDKVQFRDTLKRCLDDGVIPEELAVDLRKLASHRNPLSHYRPVEDASNLDRRTIDSMIHAGEHLLSDATFAISTAVRLLAQPVFRLDDGRTLLDDD